MLSSIPSISIGDRIIHNGTLPYIIAEIGVNHEGSPEKARELIQLAKEGGADAVKFQTYKADTLAAKESPAYWDLSKERTKSQHELFMKYDKFGEREYEVLADQCRKECIDFLSTPFDNKAVDFLSPLVPCFKIASADITNFPLLRNIGAKGKSVLLSTGASNLSEIGMAICELEHAGCKSIALLHCILNYPTPYENAHLNMIEGLSRAFPHHVIGYSDHTLPDPGMLILTSAYFKGARIIEKHFTFDKNLPGNDHYHAMDVADLRLFKKNLDFLQKAEGKCHKFPLPSEDSARRNARRSIVLTRSVGKGALLTEDSMTCKRPAFGISPIHWDEIIGKKVNRDLAEDQILQWRDLE